MSFYLNQKVEIIGAGIRGRIIGEVVGPQNEKHYVIHQDNGLHAEVAPEDIKTITEKE